MSELEKARRRMWDAWQDYVEAEREFKRLERAAGEDFDSPAGEALLPLEATDEMLSAAGYGDATEEGKDYIRMRYRLMVDAYLRARPTLAEIEADPFGYAHRYHYELGEGTVIRFGTNGREINGGKPIEAIPLYTLAQVRAAHAAGRQEAAEIAKNTPVVASGRQQRRQCAAAILAQKDKAS